MTTVGDLRAYLETCPDEWPVSIWGVSPSGESIYETDLSWGTGQGPSDDIDEVYISWEHSAEAERLYLARDAEFQRGASNEVMVHEPVAGWVWESNVTTLMSWLAMYANIEYGELDAAAVAHGLPETDVDADQWYEHPLGYNPLLIVYLAQHVGGRKVSVRVEGDMDAVVKARAQTLIGILAEVGS